MFLTCGVGQIILYTRKHLVIVGLTDEKSLETMSEVRALKEWKKIPCELFSLCIPWGIVICDVVYSCGSFCTLEKGN